MTNKRLSKILQSIKHIVAVRGRSATVSLLFALAGIFGLVTTPGAAGQDANVELAEEKQTTLGLYVTAKEAYEMWKAAPNELKIIDVRTREECLFVGHPAMAWNIPVAVQTWEWDAEKNEFPMKPLPDFVSRVKEIAAPDEKLLVMCRSGARSAIAVNMLAQAGFQSVYNITDGMEGDAVKDPDSVFVGKRQVNGWKNSGCPWTYELTPDQVRLPKDQNRQRN